MMFCWNIKQCILKKSDITTEKSITLPLKFEELWVEKYKTAEISKNLEIVEILNSSCK